MTQALFTPHHITANAEDLEGNGGIGRYILLPGSDGRAKKMAERFDNLRVIESLRSHNMYLGTITHNGLTIDMAVVSTGMGCPSTDIIINELFRLGARRFLRVGTSGSLQSDRIKVGDIVIPTAAVRDEHTSRNYVPTEYPSIASLDMIMTCKTVARRKPNENIHFGIVHCKDSLFAREFGAGPMVEKNENYMTILKDSGVLASEMESSQLFILSSLFNHELAKKGSKEKVVTGSILSIIGDDEPFTSKEKTEDAVTKAIDFSFEVIKELAEEEMNLLK